MIQQQKNTLSKDFVQKCETQVGEISNLSVSVMITTHNRVEELKRTCQVLESLSPSVNEVLICADGCNDNTVEFIRQNYPHYRLFVNSVGKGSVASRDFLMCRANSDLVLSLDDDSYPLQQDIVIRLNKFFQKHPQVAVASFPQRTEEYPHSLQVRDFGESHQCGSFACSAACFRRKIYHEVDGFYPRFFHMYEEPDYALQCIAKGYKIYFVTDIIIRHYFTATGRNEIRNHHRHARNEQWSIWRRCPFPYVIAVSLYRAFSQFRYATKRGWNWVIKEPLWWAATIKGLPYALQNRNAIAWETYLSWIFLLSISA